MSFSFMYMTNFNDIPYDMYENIDELYENLEYFRENYYQQATLQTHLDYIYKLFKLRRSNNGEYPTKQQYLLSFRNSCFCRFYIEDDSMFVRAAEFFLQKIGDITNLSCANVYYFTEFYMLEHRYPDSIREFNSYVTRSVISIINPEVLIPETPARPVEKSKLDLIKEKIFTFTYTFKGNIEDIKEEEKEACSICQENIEDSQKCIRLDCGHYFHADNSNCCENGNIFQWFKRNNSCPVCRKEV